MLRMMTEFFDHPHTVAKDEIDEQGHANNVCYVSWMQDAALAHSAALGWPPQRYQEIGMGWVARSHTIEYLRPAYEGEELIVQTRVADMKRATSKRVYQILRRADRELLAKGETKWAFISYATGKPIRIPDEISGAYPIAVRS